MGKYDAFEYLSLTQLGELFGVGPRTIGRWLVQIGLRTRKLTPSLQAQSEHFVRRVHQEGNQFDAWHQTKTVAALRAAGYRLVNDGIDTTPITAPFTVRSNEGDGHEIIDANGSVCVWVRGAFLADRLRKLMDLADANGKLLPSN